MFCGYRWILAAATLFLSCAVTMPVQGDGERKKVSAAAAFLNSSEQLVYEGEFSKLMLRGINIVELRFAASRAPATTLSAERAAAPGSVPNLLFKSEVKSKGWFSKLFGLRFNYTIESTVEADSLAVLRTNKLDEQGKRVRVSEAVFDRVSDKITWTERDPNAPERPPRVVTSALSGALHDIVSVLYFLRTQQLTPGKSFELPLSDSGAVYRVPAKVVEKRRIKTVFGRVSAVRVDVDIFGPEKLVNQKGECSIWFTDDLRHLPVRARFKSDIGTLELNLKSVKY